MSEPHVIKVDATLGNGDSLTIPYTITTTGTGETFTIGQPFTTSTTSGTWTATGPWVPLEKEPPDMTDWPPDDIIDWFAIDLARRNPA